MTQINTNLLDAKNTKDGGRTTEDRGRTTEDRRWTREGGREQQNVEYRMMNNEVGKKEINVWEKLFTVIDILCRILVLLATD